jgi:hypothetical protein
MPPFLLLRKRKKSGQFPFVPELASKAIKGRDLACLRVTTLGTPGGGVEVKYLGHVIISTKHFL